MSDSSDLNEIIDEELRLWLARFGGGMVPFDSAYFDALREGNNKVEATRRGGTALLDRFCDQLKNSERLRARFEA